ncbi:hypothetical protein THTE_1254 [Thermogutta terrifontis]|uniref:Uncharacterized protein n=1 Tax=Thermogutta terrifontis TaxID=1331910 RepID=A0A286RD23_9BACT|nr:hypothetical protein THTE_1254 [Thermogutta terrifontis]
MIPRQTKFAFAPPARHPDRQSIQQEVQPGDHRRPWFCKL